MYKAPNYSFALPVELTAKFFGLQYRNRTDDIKITFIVAVGALFNNKIHFATMEGSYSSISQSPNTSLAAVRF